MDISDDDIKFIVEIETILALQPSIHGLLDDIRYIGKYAQGTIDTDKALDAIAESDNVIENLSDLLVVVMRSINGEIPQISATSFLLTASNILSEGNFENMSEQLAGEEYIAGKHLEIIRVAIEAELNRFTR